MHNTIMQQVPLTHYLDSQKEKKKKKNTLPITFPFIHLYSHVA